MRLLITEPIDDGVTLDLCAAHDVVLLYETGDGAEAYASDAIIVRNKVLDRSYLEPFSNLKVIAKHGTGIDNVDVSFCEERGITLLSAPSMNAAAVAEGVVAMMLAAARRIPQVHEAVAAGNHDVRWQVRHVELAGKTLGIVGCGDIGRRVAAICAGGFGMRIIGFDPGRDDAYFREHSIQRADNLDSLLSQVDVVSLNLPLLAATRHIINHKNIGLLKKSAIIVNAARGGLIDEAALCESLNAGHLHAAALDVLEAEPLVDERLRSARNLILSPHVAGKTAESEYRVSSYIARATVAFFPKIQSLDA